MIKKANNGIVTKSFLQSRTSISANRGYGKAKWIQFCEDLMSLGFVVRLYEARKSVSKYVTVEQGDKKFKVRFSNHKPIARREAEGDCDFFVGIANQQTTTTADALQEVKKYFATEIHQIESTPCE